MVTPQFSNQVLGMPKKLPTPHVYAVILQLIIAKFVCLLYDCQQLTCCFRCHIFLAIAVNPSVLITGLLAALPTTSCCTRRVYRAVLPGYCLTDPSTNLVDV